MEISIKEENGVVIVRVNGSIDAMTAPTLAEEISSQINQGKVQIVTDFSGVEYTSSAGLRVLLGAVKDTRKKRGDLRIAGLQAGVHKVLSLSGFTSILKVFESVDEAVDSYS